MTTAAIARPGRLLRHSFLRSFLQAQDRLLGVGVVEAWSDTVTPELRVRVVGKVRDLPGVRWDLRDDPSAYRGLSACGSDVHRVGFRLRLLHFTSEGVCRALAIGVRLSRIGGKDGVLVRGDGVRGPGCLNRAELKVLRRRQGSLESATVGK